MTADARSTSTRNLLLAWLGACVLFAVMIVLVEHLPVAAEWLVWLTILAIVMLPLAIVLDLVRNRGWRAWRTVLLCIALCLPATYAVANLAIVYFVPVGLECELVLSVTDRETDRPIRDAAVMLEASAAGPIASATDGDGRAALRVHVVQQPRWAFPPVGTLEFRGYPPLIVRAEGFKRQGVELGDLGVPYSRKPITIHVALDRDAKR